MWCPQESHDHDGRDRILWNLRVRWHFGHSACSPSSDTRLRHSHSRHVASSGNSRMNSMSEYVDSEAMERCGLFRSTLDTGESSQIWVPTSRVYSPRFAAANIPTRGPSL